MKKKILDHYKLIAIIICLAMGFCISPISPISANPDDNIEITQEVVEQETNDGTQIPEVQEENTSEDIDNEGDEPVIPQDENVDFVNMSVADQYNFIMNLNSDEEIDSYLQQLSEDQFNALSEYAASQEVQEPVQSYTFTEAGPFLPAVNVAKQSRLMKAMRAARDDSNSTLVDNDGIETSKKVTGPDENGVYTLRLESYVTGTTTTTTVTTSTPVDIVLVLDQSGSMCFDFDGNDLREGNNKVSQSNIPKTRQYAMKEAVQAFIDEVADKYSEECDNRMTVVTYGSNAETKQGWTFVNETGETTLKGTVAGLPDSPSGSTNAGAGMQMAETLMRSGYDYTGANTNRQKVVIMFTDGVPTTSTDFDIGVANTAIRSSYKLKQAGATVYSVGIFNKVNPYQLHGDKIDYSLHSDVLCDGSVDSAWGASILQVLFGDVRDVDIAAGNRFLNYLSSNFKDSTEIGIKSTTKFSGIEPATCWQITKNFDRTASNYYLTATDKESLNEIFQTISQNIQTGSASVQLGTDTVVQDVISDQFELPSGADASSIKVYTADYKSDGSWKDEVKSELTATVNGKTITVTGFDFSQNYCSTESGRKDGDNNQPGDFYGRKLIIEIPIVVKDGFLGGNNVVTNTTDSEIIAPGGKVMEQFNQPTVDIPIKDVTVETKDLNVYLYGSLNQSNLATVKVGDVTLNLDADNYGLQPWQTAYVNISPDSGELSLTDITEDTTYSMSVSIEPKEKGQSSEGNVATEKSDTKEGKINVFKPQLTFKDSNVYYGGVAPSEFSNLTNTQWVHGNTVDKDETMIGTKPNLTCDYTIDENALLSIGETKYINTRKDINVNAVVKLGNKDITSFVEFKHNDCESDCSWNDIDADKKPAFLLHPQTKSLSITKSGHDSIDENQSYVFIVNGKDGTPTQSVQNLRVVINVNDQKSGNGWSTTITGLPIGAYTVSEDTNWSWRYLLDGDNSKTVTVTTSSNGEVSFTNKRETETNHATDSNKWKWLNGASYCDNRFAN
ncbi:vWA domain-containing protein [Floccifex sp.]|uniref:vWA domain-containing protein n=1 Tax=Floccifex sp. TaxID=2815810 RepID=UPI003F0CFB52